MSNTEAVRIRQEPRNRRESDTGGAACCGHSSASIRNWQRSVFAPRRAGCVSHGPCRPYCGHWPCCRKGHGSLRLPANFPISKDRWCTSCPTAQKRDVF